ncbi:xanthine dehydrogenase family protein molybdopterin-binding subunit [Muriicola sp. Z0-33]|uniref:xanthine dehydrogenase family protein molybdopterin-binding subunit n=1 Tax=Muriicola sp. Z0-33 TaxID=2816957 RepID=UPI002238F420|nr:molybdopterin cofactor-binding domain-containing protein [Muriicola sp. Z0-33]MCW5515740.1 xanthine dehydrogenase family protein molybdopterin-binding subunit [Muriicola sp. Z0-33]
MNTISTKIGRRSFIKNTSLAGGGLILGFSWLNSCKPKEAQNMAVREMPSEWFEMNGYLKIGENNLVTIMSPNPEGGQNVKTSMPMIVAEELDVDWGNVIVEQAPLNTELYSRQFIGGSQAIRRGWNGLRMAGAAARQMLMEAAAQSWEVPLAEITTAAGMLYHKEGKRSASYGEMAATAAENEVPEDIALKSLDEFKIIGTSRKNVDGRSIVTGKPMFGVDTYTKGMLTAMIVHPPAFGMQLKSFDGEAIKSMQGIKDVFAVKVLDDDFTRQHFDTCTFLEVVAIVGSSTWEVMQAQKAISVQWEPFETYGEERQPYRGPQQSLTIPAGLENTETHRQMMSRMGSKQSTVVRRDGNPEGAFKSASKVIKRTYTAPFLAHNCMEPMNFFADVRDNKAELSGPLQKAELTEHTLSARLGIPLENIDINLTRLGGGYGRRSYAHWAVEAALISQKMQAPVKLVYSREDDMTGGIYRPMYQVTYKAALDKNNKLTAIHINAGGIPESPLYANRFPAGAVENYLAESWTINTNITIGSFRAPRSNFMASAEQSFLDEVAEAVNKDPIEFRLELLDQAKNNPVGERNDYDAERYAGVLKLVKEKSNWNNNESSLNQGVSAYFCHNSYAAQVVDMRWEKNQPIIDKVTCAIDCGIVVNPDAAANLCEGGIVDGIGNALFGELTFKDGVPEKSNFDKYRMIRMSEAPKEIDVHFVKNDSDPTGLGEPTFPPVFAALANAIYKATGKRYSHQPFLDNPLNT